jgi:hypothetical protein
MPNAMTPLERQVRMRVQQSRHFKAWLRYHEGSDRARAMGDALAAIGLGLLLIGG